MAKHESEYKRVYLQADELGFYTCNPQILSIVKKEFEVSCFELLIFWEIVYRYDTKIDEKTKERTPVKATYEEIANWVGCSKTNALKAITYLIEHDLICRANVPKGRAKGIYYPNVETIHTLLEPILQGA